MKYETVTYEFFGIKRDFIYLEKQDGSFESFEAVEGNNSYEQFLKFLAENK